MTKEERHILIERYFEAETSAEEERKLRDILLELSAPDEEEREALAVMGYASVKPARKPRMNVSLGKRMLRYAAVSGGLIVIAAGLATAWNIGMREHQPQCIAYVGGVEITDEAHIMALISTQLSEMAHISEEMDTEIMGDFNEIRNALKFEEI